MGLLLPDLSMTLSQWPMLLGTSKALSSPSPTSIIEHTGHPPPSQQHRSELSLPSALQAWDIYGAWQGWGGKQTLNLEPCSKDAGFLGTCPDTKVQVSAM